MISCSPGLHLLLSNRRPSLVYIVHVADFIDSHFLLGRMNKIVTISRHIAQKVLSFAPKLSDRVSIIHHGIDLATFNASRSVPGFIRNRFGLPADTPLVSSSGSMWKNQIEFLDALVEIKKEISGVRYLLLTPMAPMPQLQAFKDRAAGLGLTDDILWLDTLRKEDMPSYYADIDIAISTFRNEGFGLWVVEALAMGTPVVAFDGGGVRDSLEGCPAGVLVKHGAREMAAEVVRILKNREIRRRMSEAGPQWVAERFSRERMINAYYGFFDSLVKQADLIIIDWGNMPKAIILMYHNIDNPPKGARIPNLYVTPGMFRFQMWYLKMAGFQVLSVQDLVASVERGETRHNMAAITFDDGYMDFYKNAYPILKQYGYPSTVFIVSELVGKDNVWDSRNENIAKPLMDWKQRS